MLRSSWFVVTAGPKVRSMRPTLKNHGTGETRQPIIHFTTSDALPAIG
jgi:hypothetical protein